MIGSRRSARLSSPFARRTAAILAISLVSGLAAYGFNLLVDAFYGPQALARVLSALGAAATLGLPAAVVSLPVVTWSGQAHNWRRRLPAVQAGFVVLGLISGGGILLLGRTFPSDWLLPVGLLVALSTYLPAVSQGALVGRTAFVAAALVTMLPNVLRFAGILVVGPHQGVSTIFWVQVASYGAAGVIGLVWPYLTSHPEAVRAVKATPWASGWVALSVMAWLSVDIFVATLHLGAQRAAGYAVIGLLGKAPFYLAQPVVLMVIGEEGWGSTRRGPGSLAIAAITAVSVLISLALGHLAMHLMGVDLPGWLLAAYAVGACALSLGYLWGGSAAQRSLHHWWPQLAACAVWVAWALLLGGGTTSLVIGYLAAQLLGAAGVVSIGWRHSAAQSGREPGGVLAN